MTDGPISDACRDVLGALSRMRLLLDNEKRLQVDMASHFERAGFAFEREVPIAGGIIDFRFPCGVGIEVKIGGRARAIYDQLEGYSVEPSISHLILATNKAMALPPRIGDKWCTVVNLGGAWL